MKWTLTAGCKVNLYLDIVGIRSDGYHELESLFYPLPAPCDVLTMRETGSEFVLTCSNPALASEKNLVARAYWAFATRTGYAPGLVVHLRKTIPMGAGLGGGSSDAACLLRWLNHQAGAQGLAPADLRALALTLGADVPFFLENRPAWITGIGEHIAPVEVRLGDAVVLVVCPAVHVNTAWAYRRWDEEFRAGRVKPRKLLTPGDGPIMEFCFANPPALWNAFEDVVFQDFPVLYEVKTRILRHSAAACIMSGSGSSFVAMFASADDAARCARNLRSLHCVCFGVRSGKPLSMAVE